jgi:hypothetical protein
MFRRLEHHGVLCNRFQNTVNSHYRENSKHRVNSKSLFQFWITSVFYLRPFLEDKLVDECVFSSYRSYVGYFFKTELQLALSGGRKWKQSFPSLSLSRAISLSLPLPYTRLQRAGRDSQLPPRQWKWWTVCCEVDTCCRFELCMTIKFHV